MLFEVTAPDGRVLEIEGDKPPSEAELNEIFGAMGASKPETGMVESALRSGLEAVQEGAKTSTGVAETLGTVGSAIVAEPLAGLAGIAGTILPGEEGQGADWVRGTREALTYQPQTEFGEEALTSFAQSAPIQAVATGLESSEQFLGDVSEPLGPAGQTMAHSAPTAILEALGLASIKGISAVPELVDTASDAAKRIPQSATKQKIAQMLSEGSTDAVTAKYNLVPSKETGLMTATDNTAARIKTGAPRVVKDPLAIEAIKQGFDEGVIAAIKGGTATDRAQMKKMVRILKRGKENARFAMENRPAQVAGDTMKKRIDHVFKVNKDAAKKLEGEARKLKGQAVDVSGPVNSFLDDLYDMGIHMRRSADGRVKADFRMSDIEDIAAAENIINRIVKRMQSGPAPDAYEVHRLKKYIDEQVSYGKAGEGLTGKTEGILKKLRADLNNQLKADFPSYGQVNTQYSDTIGAIDELQAAVGKKMDLTGPNANEALGTVTRRLMSNAQTRINLLDSINAIEGVGRKYGGKFEDDLLTQVLFADELDSVFKPVARTSFENLIGRATERSIEGGMRGGMFEAGRTAAKEGIDKLRGINEEARFKAINELLR